MSTIDWGAVKHAKGRHTVVKNRANAIIRMAAERNGRISISSVCHEMFCNRKTIMTAVNYIVEDGLGVMYLEDVLELTGGTDGDEPESKHLDALYYGGCSYCVDAVVEPFVEGGDEPVREAIRQQFHVCKGCLSSQLPDPMKATVARGTGIEQAYPTWNNPRIGEAVVLEFQEWMYAQNEKEQFQLYAIITLPESDEPEERWSLCFTYDDENVPTKRYSRGYKWLKKQKGHVDHLIDTKLVISREQSKTNTDKWFWSWTSHPRLPYHLQKNMQVQADVDTTVEMDGHMIPADVNLPEHHIHSISDRGNYTIIRINKNVVESNSDRVDELETAIRQFVMGEITVSDLAQIGVGQQ
jgi:hypothetical protein